MDSCANVAPRVRMEPPVRISSLRLFDEAGDGRSDQLFDAKDIDDRPWQAREGGSRGAIYFRAVPCA